MELLNRIILNSVIFVGIAVTFFWLTSSGCIQANPEEVASGKDLYFSYCQICHGDDADGHGPMANLLKVKPLDLRLIAERREGKFDDQEIYDIIDGTKRLNSGHGNDEMPIWSVVFANEEGVGAAMAPGKIQELVSYLKSLQLKKAN